MKTLEIPKTWNDAMTLKIESRAKSVAHFLSEGFSKEESWGMAGGCAFGPESIARCWALVEELTR